MRVLLCADSPAGTASATSWLESMAPAEPAALRIAAVAQSAPPALPFSPALKALRALLTEGVRRRGEAAASELGQRWRDVTLRIMEGEPLEQLLRAAAEWKPELVVLGLTANSGPVNGGAGLSPSSLARLAAHHLDCSVFLTAGAPRPEQQIVLGMDGSSSAREALR